MRTIGKLLTVNLAVACLATIPISSASDAGAAPPAGVMWLRVADDVLSGTGINDSIESAKHIERPEEKAAAAILRKTIFSGQLRTSVVQMRGDTLHLPTFPDDEVFCVIVGSVILAADDTKIDQVFDPGDCGFVPKGWAGVWRQPDSGMYREIAVVPVSFTFDVSIKSSPPVKGARAFAIEAPTGPGTHPLHRGNLIVEVDNAAHDDTRMMSIPADETIHILRGNLTLKAADRSETFKPGDIVILPQGLNVELRRRYGYRALVVRAK